MNFAENVLCGKPKDDVAVISVGEENLWTPETYTWQELGQLVEEYADALRCSGLKKGEVVAGILVLILKLILKN